MSDLKLMLYEIVETAAVVVLVAVGLILFTRFEYWGRFRPPNWGEGKRLIKLFDEPKDDNKRH